jgi:hypothetical protein
MHAKRYMPGREFKTTKRPQPVLAFGSPLQRRHELVRRTQPGWGGELKCVVGLALGLPSL